MRCRAMSAVVFVLLAVGAGCKSTPDVPKERDYQREGTYTNPNHINPLTGRYPSGLSTLF